MNVPGSVQLRIVIECSGLFFNLVDLGGLAGLLNELKKNFNSVNQES